jgi:regulation of enolase protein 1 (concanavalin A-like superfamily)
MAAMSWADMTWLNEPPAWSEEAGRLEVVTGDRTDFWQETFYGFHRDDGHFYHRPVDGDFTAEVTFDGAYEALYDQGGLMLRLDGTHWLKAGIEFTDGVKHFSVVVTNGRSDWSVIEAGWAVGPVTARISRHGEAVRVQYRDGARAWRMARLGYLPQRPGSLIGVMCCSPQRSGFRASFTGFQVGPPIARDLHADT